MKQLNLFIITIILAALAIGMSIVGLFNKPKPGVFIRTKDVFEQFEMTKEKKAMYENISNSRIHLLDSMELDLKLLADEIQQRGGKSNEALFQYKRQQYLRKKQEVEEDNQRLSATYDQEIWTRLNQYAKDHGQSKGYGMLFGANGDGTVMYADDNLDVTDEFIAYINSKYKGL